MRDELCGDLADAVLADVALGAVGVGGADERCGSRGSRGEGKLNDDGGESLCGRWSGAFKLAEAGATIIVLSIAVIAEFEGCIEDTVSAASEGTVGTTETVGEI